MALNVLFEQNVHQLGKFRFNGEDLRLEMLLEFFIFQNAYRPFKKVSVQERHCVDF